MNIGDLFMGHDVTSGLKTLAAGKCPTTRGSSTSTPSPNSTHTRVGATGQSGAGQWWVPQRIHGLGEVCLWHRL